MRPRRDSDGCPGNRTERRRPGPRRPSAAGLAALLTAGAIALGGTPAAAEGGGAGERAPAATASPTEVRLRGIWDAVAAWLAAAAAERAQLLRPPRPHKVV